MMRAATLVLVAASTMAAQTPNRPDLLKLTDQLEAAIQAGDWPNAAQISRSLDEAVRAARNHSMASAGLELTGSILAWLPADTETLVVAQEPFMLVATDHTTLPDALAGAQSYVAGLLAAAEKERLYKELLGHTVRLAVLAARRFGDDMREPPPGSQAGALGMIPYQGCAVYAFSKPMEESAFGRPPEESIMGHRVWTSKGSQNDWPDTDTYYASLLKPDTLMVCNHREFFQEVVSRIGLPPERRALPSNLPEWKQVDRAAPLWAVCHYRDGAFLTSLMSNAKDPGATGLTVEFGLPLGRVRARMLSKSNYWEAFSQQPELANAAKSRETEPGVWELSLEGTPQAGLGAVFGLMAMLGFVVLL